MNWTVLSSCGTSLLTNGAEENLRKLLIRKSNEKRRDSITESEVSQIHQRIETVSDFLKTASKDEVAKVSAELNAIIKLYGERERIWGNRQDFHWLICTDTWLGEATANLVKDWLEKEGFFVQVQRQDDLQTQTINEFQLALSDLTKWCYDNLPNAQQPHSRVIFNLTGGFKSVNGFLQTLGMFRADEIVYIFEGEKKLLSIPRLPISLASKDLIQNNLQDFRRLSLGLEITDNPNIPETLLLKIDNQITLSAWGEIQWNECKKDIYGAQVFPPPDKNIKFGEGLEKQFNSYSRKFVEINEQIDLLAKYLNSDRQQHLKSLGFEKVKSTDDYEFKAWDDEDGKRFFGHFENDTFIIDKLAKGVH